MEQIIIRYVSLPCSAKGYVREDANGDYNVYINSNLSYETQRKTIRHELRHIKNRDFTNALTISEAEGAAESVG